MKTKALLLFGLSLTAMATQAQIYPTPQSLIQSGNAFASASATFSLTGAATADADAVAALNAGVKPGSGVEIVIGEAGDAAVASVASKIPSQAQGYYLSVTPAKVTIAGRDGEGTYYGVQSFLQLLDMEQVPAVEVSDWPTTAVRGVIEGYYGNPWSHEDCLDMYEFFDRNKMNTFIYGPKNDDYHKEKWAEEYPADQAAKLSELAKEGLKHKVHFTWAMHPGNKITGDYKQMALAKFRKMYDLGIRRFAVFFDDISAESVQSQIEYLNYLNKELVKAKGDVAPLIVCPTEYCISFSGGWNTTSTYLPSLGSGLDKDIEIMWTGAGVVDMNQKSAAEWFTGKTGRKPFIWLNYPVTDYGYEGGPLLMSPYEPAAADIHTLTTAFCSNPMEYYEASKVALYGIADFAWNPAKYDPWTNWNAATEYIMPEHVEAFRTYCYSNFYYPSNTHGLTVAYDETPEFTALQAANPKHNAAYAPYFEKQVATADELLSLTDNRLVKEIKEWIEVYQMQGQRGLTLETMRAALENKEPEKFIEAYREYKALTEAASTHLSRGDWAVRNYLPKSAPQFVEPFIKKAVAAYVDDFRNAGYSYPSDLFPPQILENGNYYIVYQGKLLSNGSGAAADRPGNPTFRTEIDNINSARQSWTIKFDSDTKRYSILSTFDDRYVNELGNFGTNPYENIWHTFEILPLGDYYAIRNGGSAGNNFWSANGTRVEKGASASYSPANFLFQIVPVDGEIPANPKLFDAGEYLIYNEAGDKILTRGSGYEISFVENTGGDVKDTQKWTITLDNETKRYKMTQGSDFVNEKGEIGGSNGYGYTNTWNSYELYSRGGKFAFRNGGLAGDNFWYITNDGKIQNEAAEIIDSFQFRLVDPNSPLEGIEEVTAGDAPAGIYDLQGRKVVNPGRGLYIINGKKVKL